PVPPRRSSDLTYTTLAEQVDAAFDERLASRSQALAELTANRKRLEAESDKLLAAHFADAIDLDTLKRHQDRIRIGLTDIDRRLTTEHGHHEGPRKHLGTALRLLVDCGQMYARTDDHGRRLANQTFYDRIDISEDERATIRLAEPFAALTPEPTSTDVRCSSTSSWVELGGFEPPTSSMPWKRATNCAIAPRSVDESRRRSTPLTNSGTVAPTTLSGPQVVGGQPPPRPAARVGADECPGAVVQAREPQPALGVQVQQMGQAQGDRRAVRDDDEHAVVVHLRHRLQHRRRDPAPDLVPGVGTDPLRLLALPPCPEGLRPTGLDLGLGEPLPHAERPLAQPGVRLDRQPGQR